MEDLVYESGFLIECKVLQVYNGPGGEVVIPEGVQNIDEKVFSGREGQDCITSIRLPNSFESYYIQSTCFSLQNFVVSSENPNYCEIDGVLFNKEKTVLVRYPAGRKGKYTIPESVRVIEDGAFLKCRGLKDVILPMGIESIGSCAFCNCESLTSVTIPDSVKSIGLVAFEGCTNLTSVTIPDSVKSIGLGAFEGCTNLNSVTIPNSVKSIDDRSFKRCTSLSSVTIPNSVKSIDDRAFEGCTSLTSVTIPDSVKSIGRGAFEGCENLTNVTIPDSVTSIKSSAFRGCTSLTSVTIPDSVTSIECYTFSGCTNLTSVTIPDSVTSIERYAFSGCTNLTSVTIPDSVTSIEFCAFSGCSELTDISIKPRKDIKSFHFHKWFPFSDHDNEKIMVYPKLSLSVIKERANKRMLALGYCTAPEKYEQPWAGEYQRYVRSQRQKLLELAKQQKCEKAEAFLTRLIAESPPKKRPLNKLSDSKKVNKLSDPKKVKLLEQSVLTATAEELEKLCRDLGHIPFMSRALGYACGYGSLEKVKVLIQAGASFQDDWWTMRKYKAGRLLSDRSFYPANYPLLLAYDGQDIYIPMRSASNKMVHFGDDSLPENLLPQQERVQIALYLLTCGNLKLNTEELLYYAILWNNQPLADALSDRAELSKEMTEMLAVPKNNVDRDEFSATLMSKNSEDCLECLRCFKEQLDKKGQKLALTQAVFKEEKSPFFNLDVMRFLLEHTDTSKLRKFELLRKMVETENIAVLELLVNFGWIEQIDQRDKLIDYAVEQKKTQALAWLLDYKNRTADFQAEEKRRVEREKRKMRQLFDPVAAMKKVWSWKEREDGTLCLTSYKGSDTEVVIPGVIGKKAVTALEKTFSCYYARGLTSEMENTRKSLSKVTIPDSVVSIDRYTFAGCNNLTIRTSAGSYAELYAMKYRIRLETFNKTMTGSDNV